MMRTTVFLAMTIALSLVTALPAATFAQTSAEDSAKSERNDPVTVRVVNNNWLDVRVYAVRGSFSQRLGTVTGLTAESFKLPRAFTVPGQDVYLVAQTIGGRGAHYSFPILVFPGDEIEYRIQNNLALSSTTVRP